MPTCHYKNKEEKTLDTKKKFRSEMGKKKQGYHCKDHHYL